MSKITKKQLHNGWHCHDTEIIKMKKELRELKQSVLRLEKLTDEKLLDEPQLKQLDQSIFDGLDEKWRFAAVDADGCTYAFMRESEIDEDDLCFIDSDITECKRIGDDYDTTDWQNSLIERDIAKELTGSELCKAMLERGDRFVMCMAGDGTDVVYDLACFVSSTHPYIGRLDNYRAVTPINNQGEPLTASEVGL